MATVETLAIKSLDEIRDDYLRTYRNSLIKRGIENPVVGDGTEIHMRATALAQQVYVATSGIPVAANAQMPDTAQEDDLIRVARIYGLSLRPAGPSAGPLVLDSTIAGAVAIPTGAQLIDGSGFTYEVSVGGAFLDGEEMQITSVDTGTGTNLAEGTVLRWTAPPPFVQPTAVVGVGGLTGGVDAEDIEGLRARLLERLQNPPNGANWPAFNLAAEQSSTAVQKGFTYPACNGPSTVHVAVVTSPTATNKERDVNTIVMNTQVIPGVQAIIPEYAELLVTTVENVSVDVSVGISIPPAKTASPPGPGGGWTDGDPFPVFASQGYANVTAVTNSTAFSVNSDIAPLVGSEVCWISRDDWVFRTAAVVSFTGTGPYAVVIDYPFTSANGVNIAVGDFVFPNAEKMEVYVPALLEAFARLGPGQKTNLSGLLPRALRRPLVTQAWPSDLNQKFLNPVRDSGDEVDTASYLYKSATSPALPAVITDPPKIFIPGRLAFYPLE